MRSQLIAVAVAESKAVGAPDKPSTSFSGIIRLVRESVLALSVMGSCKIIPWISESAFSRRICS